MAAQLALEDVAQDAFRREFFLRAFPVAEAEVLELRFAFLHRVRQFKRLVGRRDLLPAAAQDIVEAYLQLQEGAPVLLAPDAESLRLRVLRTVELGHCPLDLFCGLETHVRAHMARDAFPRFVCSPEYAALCTALRGRRELPLAEMLVDARRTQFLARFLREAFPGEEGNLRFWVEVQTRFLPLIQTSLFSVALFEQVQRHVRRIFNEFLVASTARSSDTPTSGSTPASRVTADVRRDTLQQIMRLQSEPFSPPRYASLFRAAQDCVWEWLQTEVYPKFRSSTFYVLLVVETEDLETDRQLRRLSEHVQAATKASATVHPELEDGDEQDDKAPPRSTSMKASEAQLKASAVLVPIKQSSPLELWRPKGERNQSVYSRALKVPELAAYGIRCISFASLTPTPEGKLDDCTIDYELICAACHEDSTAEGPLLHLDHFGGKLNAVAASGGRRVSEAVSIFHDFVLSDERAEVSEPSGQDMIRHLSGVCMILWPQANKSTESKSTLVDGPAVASSETGSDNGNTAPSKATSRSYLRFVSVLTTRPLRKACRRLLLQLATIETRDVMVATITDLVAASLGDLLPDRRRSLVARYSGFYLNSSLGNVELSLHTVFKEIGSQTFTTLLASLLVGKSVVMVSERSSALLLLGEGLRVLLRPFQWTHFYLPCCSAPVALELRDAGRFASASDAPFLLGCEGVLVNQKQKELGVDQRYRIRSSIYNVHRVSLQLQPPVATKGAPKTTSFPPELLQTQAIVVDIDADDVYIPELVEIPEFPHSLVRSLESLLATVLHSTHLTQADTHLFGPVQSRDFRSAMLETQDDKSEPVEPEGSKDLAAEDVQKPASSPDSSLDDGIRLAFLWFLEALFGDVAYYSCSFHQTFAVEKAPAAADEMLLFEVDSFLDAHAELGCRDLFRQCFHTQLFRNFLLAQHMQFALSSPTAAPVANGTTTSQHQSRHGDLPASP